MKKQNLFFFFFLLTLLSFSQCSSQENAEKTDNELDQKIGQLIMVGFRGTAVSDTSVICQQIRDYHLGGVMFFEYDVPGKFRPRNIASQEQVKKLAADLKKYGREDILIAVDEEGGRVSRLRPDYGYQAAMSPQRIGKIGNLDSTHTWAAKIADKVKSAGVNVNYAPVVDVNVNPASPVIGAIERSISADPDSVTLHAEVFIEEHKKENIICSLKHFPGHGSATSDSHEGFTDVTDTWSEIELEPYRQLIADSTVDAIMTAHVFNSNWDTVPATLSKNVITGVLRGDLGWNGIVMSDDMQMGAVSEHYGFEKGIELALNAGVDILLLSNNSATVPYDDRLAEKTFMVVKKLVAEGKVPVSRIEESYERVMRLKNKFGFR
jgi:beta-N-acetylhexosaminidase